MDDFILDKIILGHNQFFGTDHMSTERGAERASFFSKIENVVHIIRFAYENGATGLMLSTHENTKLIVDELVKDEELKRNLNIYVLLPYMAKYVRMANERGMVDMIGDILGDATWKERLGIMSRGGMGVLKKDITGMLKTLIDIELLPFKKVNMKAVFLHNALSDMVAGLKLGDIAHFFSSHITEKYQVAPAFCTLNSPKLMNFLNDININNPVLMAPFNPIGFQMNPSKEEAENVLSKIPSQMIAMSTLAAGYVNPKEAYAYLSSLPNIKSVIVGASSQEHINESFKHINENFNFIK
jgi:hypothetical protein